MGFKSDIEIAQECEMLPITQIAEKAGIDDKYLEQYGKYKAKIDYNLLKESDKKDGKLILVTAINPTPAGEGKTTTTVGLADGMQRQTSNIDAAKQEVDSLFDEIQTMGTNTQDIANTSNDTAEAAKLGEKLMTEAMDKMEHPS